MGSVVSVSRNHQVVVPREAREAPGVGAGDELVVKVENGRVLIKAAASELFQAYAGTA